MAPHVPYAAGASGGSVGECAPPTNAGECGGGGRSEFQKKELIISGDRRFFENLKTWNFEMSGNLEKSTQLAGSQNRWDVDVCMGCRCVSGMFYT